jgi:adenine deaminase
VNRLLALRGGVVIVDGAEVAWELPLPVAGIMTRLPLADAARREDDLHAALRDRGYTFHDPFFTMLFLAADFLPAVRLSPLGVWDVKGRRVLLPARRRHA